MSVILTVYSREEQIGKTTFAINMGSSLIQEARQTVLFLDLNTIGDGLSAHTILKLFSNQPLTSADLSTDQIDRHITTHSSQLDVLTVDASVVQDEAVAQHVITTLLHYVQTRYDYILIDVPSQPNRMTYAAIDCSAMVVFFSTSSEHEYPVEILGKQLRHVVILKTGGSGRVSLHKQGCYYLPRDPLALDTFRGTGIPFVIQSPHRPISQVTARLARDIGNRRMGIALIGGASLGLSQLGMLEIFERNRIAIDMIVGTGFGAFIGACYALGIDLSRLTRYLVSWAMEQTYVFRMHSFVFRGKLLHGKRLQEVFETFLRDVYFEELQIPLHVTALNVRAGQGVIFREGKVLDAIISSMRIAGLFVPFKETERYLVDNSMFLPTLLRPLHQMGAHILIAVQIPLLTRESGRSFAHSRRRWWHVGRRHYNNPYANQALMAATFDSLMDQMTDHSHDTSDTQRVDPDVIVAPKVSGVSWRDFHKINDLIEAGAQAAEAVIPTLEELKK
jgi:NTE family protein